MESTNWKPDIQIYAPKRAILIPTTELRSKFQVISGHRMNEILLGNTNQGAEDLPQRLTTSAALPEDPGSIASNQVVAYNPQDSSS